MITFGILREILTDEGLSLFDKPLIVVIKRILAENPKAQNDTELSVQTLWLLAEVYVNNSEAFTPYAKIPSSETLTRIVQLLYKLKTNNLLTQENMHLMTNRTIRQRVLERDDSAESNFLIQHIEQYDDWQRVYKWLDARKQFTLANLQAIASHLSSFSSALSDYSDSFNHNSHDTRYHGALTTILIKNPENAKAILEVLYSNITRKKYHLNVFFVNSIKDNNITNQQTMAVLSNYQTYLSGLSAAEVQAYILARHDKLQQWIHAARFLEGLNLLTVANFETIGPRIDALAEAIEKAAGVKFESPAEVIFKFIMAHPEHVDVLVNNQNQDAAIIFLLEKRPASHEEITKHAAHAPAAKSFIELLSGMEQLTDGDLDFLFNNLSAAPSLYSCAKILADSGLIKFYQNIRDKRQTAKELEELARALRLVSNSGADTITKEIFGAVWNFTKNFAEAARLVPPAKNTAAYMLASPEHAVSIATAMIVLNQNDNLQKYEYLILRYPQYAKVLMIHIRTMTYINTMQDEEKTAVIDFITAHPEDVVTATNGYIRLRHNKMLHHEAFELMTAHPKHVLDIAIARSEVDKTNLDDKTKAFLKHNIPYEIVGKIPEGNPNGSRAINNAGIMVELIKIGSDYANFLIGKMHAADKINVTLYFHNAQLYLNKVPATSAWYLSAQQEWCEVLFNECVDLYMADDKQFETYKEKLDEVVQILYASGEKGLFLETLERNLNSALFTAKAKVLLPDDVKFMSNMRSQAVQTDKLLNQLWTLKPATATMANSAASSSASSEASLSAYTP